MKIFIGFKYLLIVTLGLLILITIFGLFHTLTNPGMKSISILDLKQLGTAIVGNIVFLAFIIWIIRKTKE